MNSRTLKKTDENSYKTVKNLEKCLKAGYKAMSRINLSLAEESVALCNEAQTLSEQNLRSVNKSDS